MVNYHITPDNRRLRCDAKVKPCKYGSANHFPSAKAADAYLSLAADTLPQVSTPAQKLAQQALSASLFYTGAEPAWWAAYRAEVAQNEAGFDIQPEILDVIATPAGDAAVIWQRETADKSTFYLDAGLTTRNVILRDMATGTQLGYLRLESMDDASVARSFGTDQYAPFRYHSRFGSSAYYDDDDLELDAATCGSLAMKQRLWYAAQQHFGTDKVDIAGEMIYPGSLTREQVPTDERQLDADLARLGKRAAAKLQDTRRRTAMPFVSYASLQRPVIGQGIGTAMYIYAGRKLAQENLTFRSSDTQTGYGSAMWTRLAKNFPTRVKRHSYRFMGRTRSARTFDFR